MPETNITLKLILNNGLATMQIRLYLCKSFLNKYLKWCEIFKNRGLKCL